MCTPSPYFIAAVVSLTLAFQWVHIKTCLPSTVAMISPVYKTMPMAMVMSSQPSLANLILV